MQLDLEELTLSPGDTLASRLALPGNGRARTMTAISGRKCIGSWTRSGPLGSLERMLLGTSAWGSMTCFLTWSASTTPAGRLLFRLVPSTPRTDATGFGLWQTPVADDAPDREAGKINNRGEPKLSGQVKLWPTPKSSPSGPDFARMDRPESGGHDLATAVALWLTPLVRDARTMAGAAAMPGRQGGETLAETIAETEGMDGQDRIGGSLNPPWVEWLMGFPEGWTDLER